MTEDLTVAQLVELAEDLDEKADVEALLEKELEGENRVTAVEGLEDIIDEFEDEPDPEDEPGPDVDGVPRIVVKNPDRRPKRIAGRAFAAYEAKRVRRDGAIVAALKRGQLQFVSH